MLKLQLIQAEFGDSMILNFGSQEKPRYILIDGGPERTYKRHLKEELQVIKAAGGNGLDLVILSHVDTDHIIGLLDMLSDLQEQRSNGVQEILSIAGLWHNSFSDTIEDNAGSIQSRLRMLLANAGSAGAQVMSAAGMALSGIGQGRQLRLSASALSISINRNFARDLISVDDVPNPINIDNLSLRIVGPTKDNLENLRKDWIAWLDEHEDILSEEEPFIAAKADCSIPNLSSIMILAEADGGKKILFTGDGRGDHLLQGLQKAGLLADNGRLHVDVLKVPHHGSDRNVNKTFFKKITADKYVISANGKHGNPDLSTLIWIVESAREQQRPIEIIVTNETYTTEQLVNNYNPIDYHYTLTVMPKSAHSMTIDISS
jgi:ribonuclease BN (tRNA processing enzyme)